MNKHSSWCAAFILLFLLPNQLKAITLTFTTSSVQPVTIAIKNNVLVSTVDNKTGHYNGVVKPENSFVIIKKDNPITVTPKSNVFTFSAQTKNSKQRSKEYFIYLPSLDQSIQETTITVNARKGGITFSSKIPIEENQPSQLF